jgi:hypothetical protein
MRHDEYGTAVKWQRRFVLRYMECNFTSSVMEESVCEIFTNGKKEIHSIAVAFLKGTVKLVCGGINDVFFLQRYPLAENL